VRYKLCSENDVPESGSIIVPFFGREVHVYRSDGRVRVAANVCLHFGGPLECRDGAFVCPWHGASYDMASGKATGITRLSLTLGELGELAADLPDEKAAAGRG